MANTNIATIPSDDLAIITDSLTSDEQKIIKTLLASNEVPDKLISEDATAEELWTCLTAACKGTKLVQSAGTKIKLYLGAVLTRIQDHPELYNNQGYKTFNEFMSVGVPALFGVSRAEAYLTKRIIEETGNKLTIDQMSEIGISNMNIASQAIRQRTPSGVTPEQRDKVVDYWIDAAKTDSFQKIKERAANQGVVDSPQDFNMVQRTLNLKESTDQRWMEFRKQPWVAANGGGTDSTILEAMMDECACWEAKANEAKEEK
jgi:hypothetical protein